MRNGFVISLYPTFLVTVSLHQQLWVVSRFVDPAPTFGKRLRATDKSSATSGSEPTVVPMLTVPSTPLIETPRNAHDAAPPSSDAVAQALLAREAAKTTDPDGALLYSKLPGLLHPTSLVINHAFSPPVT